MARNRSLLQSLEQGWRIASKGLKPPFSSGYATTDLHIPSAISGTDAGIARSYNVLYRQNSTPFILHFIGGSVSSLFPDFLAVPRRFFLDMNAFYSSVE